MADTQKATPRSWQNRIIGHGEEAPDQLLANPKNWRVHPAAQQQGMEAVLDTVGWVQSVVVNKRTGFLVDGHLRVTLALRRSEPMIPVVYVDLDPVEEDLILATIDPLASIARTDQAKIAELLADIGSADMAAGDIVKMIAEDAGLIPACLQDADSEWKGMPEFEQEDQLAHRQVIVSFSCDEDADSFFKLVGQSVTPKTKSIWYPKQESLNLKALEVVHE
jgi:hypothetical protein